jgi:hypothetical protein
MDPTTAPRTRTSRRAGPTSSPTAGGDWDKGNGTASLIGNLSGDDVDLRGNGEVRLDECVVAAVSPALFVTRTENYRELDN